MKQCRSGPLVRTFIPKVIRGQDDRVAIWHMAAARETAITKHDVHAIELIHRREARIYDQIFGFLHFRVARILRVRAAHRKNGVLKRARRNACSPAQFFLGLTVRFIVANSRYRAVFAIVVARIAVHTVRHICELCDDDENA